MTAAQLTGLELGLVATTIKGSTDYGDSEGKSCIIKELVCKQSELVIAIPRL